MRAARTAALVSFLAMSLVAASAAAQTPSQCFAIAKALPGATFASLRAGGSRAPEVPLVRAAYSAPEVTITYANHSTFRIESPEGIIVATDYAGYAGKGRVPDVVTMNHAHTSHYTDFPDPAIRHALRGWNPAGGAAEHHLDVGDVMIRNVPTDIRRGGFVEPAGNSIFIFETAGLCIGHLGHLHHEPTEEHYAAIGRLDVVMVPVDGAYTMAQMNMANILDRMRVRIVLPMHYFGIATLTNFISNLGEGFVVEARRAPSITVSLTSLPETPTVIVLPPS